MAHLEQPSGMSTASMGLITVDTDFYRRLQIDTVSFVFVFCFGIRFGVWGAAFGGGSGGGMVQRAFRYIYRSIHVAVDTETNFSQVAEDGQS